MAKRLIHVEKVTVETSGAVQLLPKSYLASINAIGIHRKDAFTTALVIQSNLHKNSLSIRSDDLRHSVVIVISLL